MFPSPIPSAAAPSAAPATAAPTAGSPADPPPVATIPANSSADDPNAGDFTGDTGDLRVALARALCRTMAQIHRRGWCEGTGGNFSCVLSPPPQLQLLMAPSGVDKGRVRPSQLLLVDAEGVVLQGKGRTSAEMPLHRTIVEETGAGAVLHTHSQAATLLSRLVGPEVPALSREAADVPLEAPNPEGSKAEASQGEAGAAAEPAAVVIEGLEMLKGLEGIRTHRSRIRLPVLPNDQDLIRLSAAARPHLAAAPYGLLIAGHGLYAWGADLAQAQRHLEILEFLLEQHWREQLWHAIASRPTGL